MDKGAVKGRKETMFVGKDNVLWDKGVCILDWNRNQRFVPLTEEDKLAFDGFIAAKQYSYPRKRGNMLLNYESVNGGDWKRMYWQKNDYYATYEKERKYKEMCKRQKQHFRSYEEMKMDIDKHHRYFMRADSVDEDDDWYIPSVKQSCQG